MVKASKGIFGVETDHVFTPWFFFPALRTLFWLFSENARGQTKEDVCPFTGMSWPLDYPPPPRFFDSILCVLLLRRESVVRVTASQCGA